MNANAVAMTFHCFDRDCPVEGRVVRGKSTAACLKRAIAKGWRNIGGDAWLCPRCARMPTAEQSRDELLAACEGILAIRVAMAGKGSYSIMEEEAIAAVETAVRRAKGDPPDTRRYR